MDEHSLGLLLGFYADAHFEFAQLVRLLEEKGFIKRDELKQRCTEERRAQFNHDLLEELVSRGLRISEDSLSASRLESPSSSESATRARTDPESQKKS